RILSAMKSMTGYGRGECARDGFKVTVELGAVNRRQSEISVNLPRELECLKHKFVTPLTHESRAAGFRRAFLFIPRREKFPRKCTSISRSPKLMRQSWRSWRSN